MDQNSWIIDWVCVYCQPLLHLQFSNLSKHSVGCRHVTRLGSCCLLVPTLCVASELKSRVHVSVGVQEFMNTYANFLLNMKDMDRRLGTIVARGFDDCTTLESAFKVGHRLMFVLLPPPTLHSPPITSRSLAGDRTRGCLNILFPFPFMSDVELIFPIVSLPES